MYSGAPMLLRRVSELPALPVGDSACGRVVVGYALRVKIWVARVLVKAGCVASDFASFSRVYKLSHSFHLTQGFNVSFIYN